MEEKLIRRAAIKYQDWMTQEKNKPSYDGSQVTLNLAETITRRTKAIQRWNRRFITGMSQRIQTNKWEKGVVHRGIFNPNPYKRIATKLIPDINERVIKDIKLLTDALREMTKETEITPLSLKEAIEEIRIIDQAWENVKFRSNVLSVLIKNVVLSDGNEEVGLGSFRICINLSDPIEDKSIESINQIESSGGYYHPHVRHSKLCTGNSGIPAKFALYQGRLEDYFRIVEATLRTYNENSPHEDLIQWYNPSREDEFYCDGCSEWMLLGDEVYCERCSTQRCDGCAGGGCCCDCDNWRCDECVTSCNECGETICNDCVIKCSECANNYCMSCLGACVTCEATYCRSCMDVCDNCGDSVCNDCSNKCLICEETFCSTCIVDEACLGCGKSGICTRCNENRCEHCGVNMCEDCSGEHNCLLANVSS